MANVNNTNGGVTHGSPSVASETNGHLYILNDNIVRIADALEEILRLVKKDQEESKKRWAESEKD